MASVRLSTSAEVGGADCPNLHAAAEGSVRPFGGAAAVGAIRFGPLIGHRERVYPLLR
jgi:hypothetical protein